MNELATAIKELELALKRMHASGEFTITLPKNDKLRIEYFLSCAGVTDSPDIFKGLRVMDHEIKLGVIS